MRLLDALRAARSLVGWLRFGGFARRNPVVVAVAVAIGLAFAGGARSPGTIGLGGAICIGIVFALVALQRRVMRRGLVRVWHAGGSHRGGSRRGH